MTAGHLQEKNGYFYVVLSYKDSAGKRKTKWIPTGLPVKGNKKKAEAFLMEQRKAFEIPVEDEPPKEQDEQFADYLERWLQIAKSTIAVTTYSSYDGLLKSAILPWFRKNPTTLTQLTAKDIQDFYTAQLKRVKPNTVIHYHAVIHRALKYAVKTDLIPVNPADKVDRPKKNSFQPSFYDKDEINRLFEAAEGNIAEVPIKLAAFYGLRKSEVLGLKWDVYRDCQGYHKDKVQSAHAATIAARSCIADKAEVGTGRESATLRELLLSRLRGVYLHQSGRQAAFTAFSHRPV